MENNATVNVKVKGLNKALEKAKELQAILENCKKLSAECSSTTKSKIDGITINLRND